MGPNAIEIDTNKMKCTWPMREFCVGDPMQPILHLFAFGVGVGVTQILVFLDVGENFALGV